MADAQTPTPAEVLAFLHGAGEIDGVGFGDRHPTLPGAFWWRRHLPLLAAQAPAQPDRAVMQQALDAMARLRDRDCWRRGSRREDDPEWISAEHQCLNAIDALEKSLAP